jgi:hypothetical protein
MEIDSWTCTSATWSGVRHLTLPAGSLGPDGAVTLEFVISEPRSPADLGLSPDSRLLGLGVESLQFL